MKILSRDFTTKEKVLLLVLLLLLVVLIYYQFVHKPVNEALEAAANEKAALEIEATAVETKVAQLEKMKAEVDDVTKNGTYKRMPSYSNSKQVNTLLNNVLGSLGYSATFPKPVRAEGSNQVRRNISLQFNAPDYQTVEKVLTQFSDSEYRCLIGDVRVASNSRRTDDGMNNRTYTVNCTLTFFETMHGGTADDGLSSK